MMLALMATGLKSDHAEHSPIWERDCEIPSLIDQTRSELSLEGFRSNWESTYPETSWPPTIDNPLTHVSPTFDDGPHPNDLRLIATLDTLPFNHPIFYYLGAQFFKKEVTQQWPHGRPENWMEWVEGNRGEESAETFLLNQLNEEMCAIARQILEAGYEIGYHGMTHAEPENKHHMQKQSETSFEEDLHFFELLIKVATSNQDYTVSHVRPPYGAGTNGLFTKPFAGYCKKNGITVGNWAISSFDWTTQEARGERIMYQWLRTTAAGTHADVLYHSPHQDGSTLGGFGKAIEVWNGLILSLTIPERRAEKEKYKEILEAIIAGQSIPKGDRLASSNFSVGSQAQISIDSAFNTEFEAQYMGAVQSALGTSADGYIGEGTVDHALTEFPEITQDQTRLRVARTLQDPNTFLASPLSGESPAMFPSGAALMSPDTTFANRGLQVRSIALDILCAGTVDETFLRSYRFQGLFIEESLIPTYVDMYEFLQSQGLDQETTARIIATALLETGVKNNLDRLMIGKGTWEKTGERAHGLLGRFESLPKTLRRVGLRDQAEVIEHGLTSVGPGQASPILIGTMFEVILERELSREEVEAILNTPEGAALGIYLHLRQNEFRLQSTEW